MMKVLLVVAAFLVPIVAAAARESLTAIFADLFTALLEPIKLLSGRVRTGWQLAMPRLWPHRHEPIDPAEATSGTPETPGTTSSTAASAQSPPPTALKQVASAPLWNEWTVQLLAVAATAVVYVALFVVMVLAEYRLAAVRFAALSALPVDPQTRADMLAGLGELGGLALVAVAVTWAVFLCELTGFVAWPTFFQAPKGPRALAVAKWAAAIGLVASIALCGLSMVGGQWAAELNTRRGDLVAERQLQTIAAAAAPGGGPTTEAAAQKPTMSAEDLAEAQKVLDEDENHFRWLAWTFQAGFGLLTAGAIAIAGVSLLPITAAALGALAWLVRVVFLPVLLVMFLIDVVLRGVLFAFDVTQRAAIGVVNVTADFGELEREAGRSIATGSGRWAREVLSAIGSRRRPSEDDEDSPADGS